MRRLERMEDNLSDDKLSGLISEQAYGQKAERLRDELSYLQLRLDHLERIESQTQVAVDRPATLAELYESESKTGKRIILLELFVMTATEGRVVFSPLAK